jgi:NADPH2:quinone reductase
LWVTGPFEGYAIQAGIADQKIYDVLTISMTVHIKAQAAPAAIDARASI